jgi:hypothetical protein
VSGLVAVLATALVAVLVSVLMAVRVAAPISGRTDFVCEVGGIRGAGLVLVLTGAATGGVTGAVIGAITGTTGAFGGVTPGSVAIRAAEPGTGAW